MKASPVHSRRVVKTDHMPEPGVCQSDAGLQLPAHHLHCSVAQRLPLTRSVYNNVMSTFLVFSLVKLTWEEEVRSTLVTLLCSAVLPELNLALSFNPVAQRCDGLKEA